MSTILRCLIVAAAVFAPGCADLMDPPPRGPDAAPMVDAGIPDAVPIDAPLPWEPTEAIIPGEPCEIVSDVPEAMYDAGMANYSIRFKDGQGLESNPDLRQTGLLEVENADLDKGNVLQKRYGAEQLADSRSLVPPEDVPDADRRAIWTRGDEVVLQTAGSIYSLNQATEDFAWRDAGPWTQMRLRENYAATFEDDVLRADHARLNGFDIVAYWLDPTGAYLRIYGPDNTLEVEETLAATGTRPRLSHDGARVVASYQNSGAGFPLTARSLLPGAASTVSIGTIFATMPAANGIWDVHSSAIDPFGNVTAWAAASPTTADFALSVSFGGVFGSAAVVRPSAIADIAVAVWPVRVSGNVRVVTAELLTLGGFWGVITTWRDFNPATGAVSASSTTSTALTDTANAGHTIAISFLDQDNIYIAVEQAEANIPSSVANSPSRKVSYFTHERGVAMVSTGIVHYATSLVTQGAIVSGTPSAVLVSAGAEPLEPAFVEQIFNVSTLFDIDAATALPRNGWVMFAPRTEEVIARSMVSFTGDYNSRIARAAKGSLVTVGDDITWGGPVSVLSAPVSDPLNSIAACQLERTQYPNAPAFADGTVVSAHAGYPRAYDGSSVFEHDWHILPRLFSSATTVIGPIVFPAGLYQLAATWEWDDSNGIRYRSAPYFIEDDFGGDFSEMNLTVESLTHTERENVNVVIWASAPNGASLHRLRTVPATNTSRIQQIAVNASQIPNLAEYSSTLIEQYPLAIIAQEQLDQGAVPLTQGVVPGERARVTDFVARGGDRLFSRDPLKGSLARFTIPSREASGYSMHWPLAFAIEEPDERDVTAALEMDGRIVLGSELGLALLTSDGPDATGAGSFGLPTTLRAAVGIKGQAQLARTPIGYVYGTPTGGAKLLTPGLTVDDLEDFVERTYKIDGANIVAITYDQNREEIVLLSDADKTLRLNTSSGRWGSDSNRLGRDLTVTRDGTVYLIRSDGKVLKQVQDAWADGATGYALLVSTPWIREMPRDGTTHSSFRIGGIYLSGEYLGAHELFIDVYRNFDDSAPWRTFTVPADRTADNHAANRGYIYGVRLGGQDSFLAARIVIRDGEEPNETFRLAQVDVDLLPDGKSTYAELPAEHYAAKV